jgi:hypothetical protein
LPPQPIHLNANELALVKVERIRRWRWGKKAAGTVVDVDGRLIRHFLAVRRINDDAEA